ncbi:SDR family NAD(P)-dependent oxidoreductase [candidate division KSB1 bacterium]|nr:SDR family NAD(P)-dependent oxidoreductase [candidate division KSB1 bacterium]
MTDITINKVALITGASSGIGRALALAMAEKGFDLMLFGRREDRLTELKSEIKEKFGGQVIPVSCDVRDAAGMKMKIDQAVKQLGRINVIVANAGYTIAGKFENLTTDDYKNIFNTNFIGMLNTLYPALPYLKESKGTVVVVGSILGEFGIMDRSAYVSTKFAMRGFYESVRYELKEMGISFLFTEPGFVSTELRHMDKAGNRIETVTAKDKKATSHGGISATPEKVAGDIIKALPKSGFRKRVITGHGKVFVFLNWLCPNGLASFIYRNRDAIRKKVVK